MSLLTHSSRTHWRRILPSTISRSLSSKIPNVEVDHLVSSFWDEHKVDENKNEGDKFLIGTFNKISKTVSAIKKSNNSKTIRKVIDHIHTYLTYFTHHHLGSIRVCNRSLRLCTK